MKTIFEEAIRQNPSITFDRCVKECEKLLGILGSDQLVNLSLEDRLNLVSKFEYTSYESRGYLDLQALVPSYAVKKDSLLLKHRENPFITTAQQQHAQKLYDMVSYTTNSYPYGMIIYYDFESWTDDKLRLNITLEYNETFNRR